MPLAMRVESIIANYLGEKDEHAVISEALYPPLVRFDLAPVPSVNAPDHHHAAYFETRVRALLGDGFSRDIRVNLRETAVPLHPIPNLSPQMARMHQEMMRGRMQAVEMTLSIALSGGQWLNVDTRFERPPLQWPLSSFLAFGLTAGLILVAVFWFVMTRLTGPLRDLSRAAEDLGRGDAGEPLPVSGPAEVRDLTRAFNRMQERLTRFVADRTRILAAVSHDLRSPLTAMRFDAELVEDEETRESLIASIDEMQTMAEATLNFAEGLAGREPSEVVDVSDWLETLADDKATPFELTGGPSMTVRIRPLALRRAVRNLVENASRYGGSATVGWHRAGDDLVIDFTDHGPGIPEEELEEALEAEGLRLTLDAGRFDDLTLEDGSSEAGTLESGTLEDGSLEDGTLEDGTFEDGTLEDGTMEDGTLEDESPTLAHSLLRVCRYESSRPGVSGGRIQCEAHTDVGLITLDACASGIHPLTPHTPHTPHTLHPLRPLRPPCPLCPLRPRHPPNRRRLKRRRPVEYRVEVPPLAITLKRAPCRVHEAHRDMQST